METINPRPMAGLNFKGTVKVESACCEIETKPQSLNFEDLLLSNDLNAPLALSRLLSPSIDSNEIAVPSIVDIADSFTNSHNNAMYSALNTPELTNARPSWPNQDCVQAESHCPNSAVFNPHDVISYSSGNDDTDNRDYETATHNFDALFEENFDLSDVFNNDPMLTEAAHFLPANTVESILVDMETESAANQPCEDEQVIYSIVGIEPATISAATCLRGLSNDHDYCESGETTVLNEFMDMTARILPSGHDDEMSICLDSFVKDNSSAASGIGGEDKYKKRREANNIACQKSRKKKRMNRAQLMEEFERQSSRHTELVAEVAHLQTMRDEWKARLLTMVGD